MSAFRVALSLHRTVLCRLEISCSVEVEPISDAGEFDLVAVGEAENPRNLKSDVWWHKALLLLCIRIALVCLLALALALDLALMASWQETATPPIRARKAR